MAITLIFEKLRLSYVLSLNIAWSKESIPSTVKRWFSSRSPLIVKVIFAVWKFETLKAEPYDQLLEEEETLPLLYVTNRFVEDGYYLVNTLNFKTI